MATVVFEPTSSWLRVGCSNYCAISLHKIFFISKESLRNILLLIFRKVRNHWVSSLKSVLVRWYFRSGPGGGGTLLLHSLGFLLTIDLAGLKPNDHPSMVHTVLHQWQPWSPWAALTTIPASRILTRLVRIRLVGTSSGKRTTWSEKRSCGSRI